jgi:glycosyltransferase involved in cell wall biosynthesis
VNRFRHTILQVTPHLNSGGAEFVTLELARAIARAGGTALVATAGGRLAPDVIKAGGEIIEAPVHSKNPLVIWRNGARLARLIKRRGVSLIHAHSRAPAWSALAAARSTGVAFVTTYHGVYSAEGALKRFYNSSMVRSDLVIANSRFTADAIRKSYPMAGKRLRIIPPGADLMAFDPGKISPGRAATLAAQWGPPGGASGFRILLPARLTDLKGQRVAIEAAALLKGRSRSGHGPALTLVLCGGAQGQHKYERALRELINERGVRDMVHMVGDCADMPAAYCWADMVIVPSIRPEAFGRAAVEAGAMGKPVIASAHGGALETVIDRESGLLVEPGSPSALADAIDALCAMSDNERKTMGDNGRARAMSVYSSAAMCEATLRAYREVLADGD